MHKTEVRPILAMIAGYWPSPAMTTEEVAAWMTELVSPSLKVTAEEARTVVIAEAESGREFRPKAGQIVQLVHGLRRRRCMDRAPALSAGLSNVVTRERAAAWARACKRIARGESMEDAKIAEGLA